MKVNGIVAEYNPFHNGHAYQMQHAKEATGADYTIVVMSGNFMQRGAPALLDKFTRAKMALECGADLVLELPICYAASSAEFFAKGSVALFDKLGVTTNLCFGSECGNIDTLSRRLLLSGRLHSKLYINNILLFFHIVLVFLSFIFSRQSNTKHKE